MYGTYKHYCWYIILIIIVQITILTLFLIPYIISLVNKLLENLAKYEEFLLDNY